MVRLLWPGAKLPAWIAELRGEGADPALPFGVFIGVPCLAWKFRGVAHIFALLTPPGGTVLNIHGANARRAHVWLHDGIRGFKIHSGGPGRAYGRGDKLDD